MKAPKANNATVRPLLGILALVLLSLPASAAWKPMAAMPTARSNAAMETINGIVYVAGGYNAGGTSTLLAYNPSTNAWTTTLANMPITLYQGNGAGVINSQLYVSGGWNGPLPTSTLFMYDPPSNSWTTKASMSHLSACGGTAVIDSKLYVTTACNGYSGYANYLDVYDPAANAWTGLPGSAIPHAAPAIGAINGKLYVAGGLDGGGAVNGTVEVYDPATSSWTMLAHMPTAVVYAASVALNGQLYVFGGNNGTADVATVQVYDPHKNKWKTLASLPAPLSSSSAVAVYGLTFIEGGDAGATTNQYSAFAPSIP
jgi:N-acetylneuraminic acid mutarotase